MLSSNLREETRSQMDSAVFSLETVARMLFVQRRFIALATVSGGIVMLCLSFLIPNTFKATTIVLPPDRTSNSIAMLGGATGNSGAPASALAALSLKSPADLYVALMSGPGVEDSVIQRYGLKTIYKVKHASEARKALERHTLIAADSKSGLISISVTDTDPDRAAKIANGIVDAFDKASASLAITDAQRRRLFFERQVQKTKDDLSVAEDNLKATKDKTGLIEPEGDARAMIAYEAQLRAQVATKTVEVESMKVYLSDENPQVQTAQRELQELRAQADILSRKSVADPRFATKGSQSEASIDYLRKLREVRYNEALFELLMKNLELAKLDEAREGNIVQVVDFATAPDMKNGPHRSFFLVGGFFLGLLLSSIGILIRLMFSASQERLHV